MCCAFIWTNVQAQNDYQHTILSGDRLRITLAEQPDLDGVYAVAGDGTLDFPMVGRILVEDMTVGEAADFLERELEQRFFKQATVEVSVSDYVEGEVLVAGAVVSPGSLSLKGDKLLTLIEAVTQCGGLAPRAAGTEVRILRWRPGAGMERQVITVDVQSMFEDLDFKNDQFLRPRDIVYVPSMDETSEIREILVLGEVNDIGFHPYTEGMDVIRAITRAGGTTRLAKLDSVRLLRPNERGEYEALMIDLSQLFGAGDMSMNMTLLPGDLIFVPSVEQAQRGQIYLLGAVAKPGPVALPMNKEATLAQTLLERGGFSQFANQGKVRVIRRAPGGTKQTLEVDVGSILKNGNFEEDIPLDSGDVIIVPEKILSF